MKRFLLWQFMLHKRLYLKKEYWILLCMIPVLVWGMGLVAEKDSGIFTVGISMEEPKEQIAVQVAEALFREESTIRYVQLSKEEALGLLASGKLDCIWVFSADFEEKLYDTYYKGMRDRAPIEMIVREDNAMVRLLGLKLYGHVFPQLSHILCREYLEDFFPESEYIPEEELPKYYQAVRELGDLFVVEYADFSGEGEKSLSAQKEFSYLFAPVRGILFIFLVLMGLVITMYYLQDEERGTFLRIPVRGRRFVYYSYLFCAITDGALLIWLSLFWVEGRILSGRETMALLLSLPVTAVFCEWMGLLCKKRERLAGCIPLLILMMLGLCPIFMDFGKAFGVQYLFPPTYYLRNMYGRGVMGYNLIYVGVLFAGATVFRFLRGRKGYQ